MTRKLWLLLGFFSHTLIAAPIVGYGSSDAVLSATDQEIFYMGFELGLKTMLKRKLPKDFLLVEHVQDRSSLGAAKSASHLIKKGVSLIAGFPTSHEALLASEVGAKANILSMASAAGHSKLAKMGPTVFTGGEAMGHVTGLFLDFIKKRFGGKRGLLVSNPNAVFSRDQETVILAALADKKYEAVQMKPFHVTSGKQPLAQDTIEALKKEKYDYIFLTTYPDDSVPLLKFIDEQELQVPILSSTWTTGEIELLRRLLIRRTAPIYSTTTWFQGAKESRQFEKLVRESYGKDASAEIAYGYDIGVVIAQTLDRVKGEFTREAVLAAFRMNPCFENTSSGKICFDPKGGHAIRKLYFVEFTRPKGFVQLKD